MLLAGKAAWAGIVFLLLTTGRSGPLPTPLASGANLSKEVPAVAHPDDVKKMQETLKGKDTTEGKSMVCSVSEPGRAFADFKRLRICQSQGSLTPRPPSNSELDRKVARRLATRRHKVNHQQV